MRPPLKKRIDSTLPPASADSKSEGLEEKARLARHLHDQGVNPLRWTEAHPARQADQRTYLETGQKVRDNQFEVGGKLYDWSPAVTATPAQAKAIADAYVATPHDPGRERAAPRIEEFVDINRVPLKHPFGTPHLKRPANDMSAAEERTALFRHYAQSGVDPDKAHLGDPLVMTDQERLKAQIEKVLPGDKTEISGLPIFYQGFDDGWIYAANDATVEDGEVKEIRRKLQQQGEPDAANNSQPGLEDEILRFYRERDHVRAREEEDERARQNDASRLRTEQRSDKMSGSATEKTPSQPKLAVDDATRKQCILDNGGCLFEVKDDPEADGDMPLFEGSYSPEVIRYRDMIEGAAKEFEIDPDLIRAVMYMETTHGYYDKPLAWAGINKSILPMNVNVQYWGNFFGDREALQNPNTNIRAGAKMLRAIVNNLPKDAPISHIASLYRSHRADIVSDYGARVARIYDEKPWNKPRESPMQWRPRFPRP